MCKIDYFWELQLHQSNIFKFCPLFNSFIVTILTSSFNWRFSPYLTFVKNHYLSSTSDEPSSNFWFEQLAPSA